MSDAISLSTLGDCEAITDSRWSVLEAVDAAIAVVSPDGIVEFSNSQLSKLTGTRVSEIVGSSIFACFAEDRREELRKLHVAALSASAKASGANVLGISMRRSDQMGRRFVIWSIANARQILRTEIPQSLLDFDLGGTEIGFWEWNIATDEVAWLNDWCDRWDLAAFEGSGHERQWTARLYAADLPRYEAALENHLAGQSQVFDIEYRVRDRQGAWVWVQERGRVVERDVSGRGLRMVGYCLNVDERYHATQALKLSESKFELAVWGTQIGFWHIDTAQDDMHWGNDWCTSMDLDPCEGPGHLQRWNAQIHPDDRPFTTSYEALLNGSADVYETECRLRTLTGGWRWVHYRGRATSRDTQGRALQVMGVTIDIDARKKATIALQESEARLSAVVSGTGIGLWDYEPSGVFRFLNDWCEKFDIDPCDGPNQPARWRAQVHPEDLQRFVRADDDVHGGASDAFEVEYRVRTRAGEWRWIHERGTVSERHADGRVRQFVGVVIDIDERKKMEAALREAENRYNLAVGAAQLPVWEYDGATDTLTGNIYWHRVAGYELTEPQARERKETWLSDIHPDDISRLAHIGQGCSADSNGFYQSECRIRLPNNQYKWLLDRARVIERGPDGQPLKVVGISIDIDDMKRLQAELREGEARLETAIGGSDIGLWDWTAGTDAIRWLSDWPARRGVKNLSELSNLSESLASIHPNDRKSLHADIRATLSGGLNRFEADYRILTLPDKWRWVHVRAKVLARDLSGRAQRIVGACVDVDTRRRQEDALRSQVAILETMREGVVVLDESGQMEFTNRAFDRMFGCPTGALVGSSIYGLLSSADPSKDLPRRLDRLLRQPGPHMEIFQRKDLTEFNGEVVTTAFDLEMGARWLLVVQDITDRRRLEQEVLDIANRERRQIGYELHDGLCQELTGVTLMLRSIATRVQRGFAPTEPQIQEAISLISTAIDNARSMARGLLPVASDRGLAPALRALTDRAKKSYGMDVRMRSIVSNELRIDNAVASQLYRIAQEAISNAVRHGGAQTVNVILRASDESIALVVSDNGSGMPSGARDGAGMGLKIMEYRARMIGGSVEVAPRRSGGTRVHCTCPAAPPMVAAQSRIF